MTIYTVTAASTYYIVRVEWDEWAVPADRDLRIFASGAASLREGGPVGESAVHNRDDFACCAEVWVNAGSEEGARF